MFTIRNVKNNVHCYFWFWLAVQRYVMRKKKEAKNRKLDTKYATGKDLTLENKIWCLLVHHKYGSFTSPLVF